MRFQHAISSGSSYVSEHPNPWAALTAGLGSLIMKLLRVFILCLAASGTARADEAAQCRANAGTFLTGRVTQGPTFAPGHLHNGVELSHTHLTLLSDQDGRSYHVAIDNVFATGYDAAGESVPAPLSTIRTGDRLELMRKTFYPRRAGHRLGPHQLRQQAEDGPTRRLAQGPGAGR
jgi:hypothetical protein